jgi:hypothetical protein
MAPQLGYSFQISAESCRRGRSINSTIEGSSLSGLLTRVETSHMCYGLKTIRRMTEIAT